MSPSDSSDAQMSYDVDWLLIFDNADHPTILRDYWPQGKGSVLITSRDPSSKSIFSMQSYGLDLELLSDLDGATLLRRLNGTGDEATEAAESATQITQLIGGIPPALSQMVGIIRRRDLTLAEFLDLYGDATEYPELHKIKFGDASSKAYTHIISTVWAVEDLRAEARKLLEFVTFLDPDNIQETLLMEAAEAICKDLEHPDRDALLANLYFCVGVISSKTRRDKKACRECCEKSLELQSNISRELGVEDERLALAYTEMGLSRLLDDRIDEGVACLSREKEIREVRGNYIPQSSEGNLVYGYMRQGRLEDADQLLCTSIKIREDVFGKNDKESFRIGRLIYMLGNLRSLQGRQDESHASFEIALAQYRANIGDRHAQTANAMYKVAEHLIRLQRYEEAIHMINDALKTWSFDTKMYKPELARTTYTKANLLKLLGKEQKATVATKAAYRLWQEMTGLKKDPTSLTTADFDPLVPFWAR